MKTKLNSSQVARLLMMTNKRTWRVQPVKNRMKAPYHFINTTVIIDRRRKIKKEVIMAQHKMQANKLAEECYLIKLGWNYILTEI